MKYITVLILLIGFLSAPTLKSLAIAGPQNGLNMTTPLVGQCVANIFSKKYLSPINANPIVYQCEYNCTNSSNNSEKIIATHNFFHSGSDFDEMVGLVCRGVHIEMIEKNGYQESQVSTHAFWSQTSDSVEFRLWARRHQLSLPQTELQRLDADLKKHLHTLIREYAHIDTQKFPEYAEALSTFKSIADDPIEGPETLKKFLTMIVDNSTANSKSESIVLINIKTLAPELVNLYRIP